MSSAISYVGTWVTTRVQSYMATADHRCMPANTLFTKPLGGSVSKLEGGLVGLMLVLAGAFVIVAALIAVATMKRRNAAQAMIAIVMPVAYVLAALLIIWAGGIILTVFMQNCTTPFG